MSGWHGRGKRDWFRNAWTQITSHVRSRKIPYAFTLGNHDDQADLSRREIIDVDKEIGGELSLVKHGPRNITGATNYWLDVYRHGSVSEVEYRLWFLDSMNTGCEGLQGSWGCIGADTVEWFGNTSRALPPSQHSMAFVHIPLSEHRLAWGDYRAVGTRQEDSACPVINTGFLTEASTTNLQAVWSGHDHRNDFVGRVYINNSGDIVSGARRASRSFILGYGRKSGYGSYGPGEISNGARVLRLWQDTPSWFIDTWITRYDGIREEQTIPYRKVGVQAACSSSFLTVVAPLTLSVLSISVLVIVL